MHAGIWRGVSPSVRRCTTPRSAVLVTPSSREMEDGLVERPNPFCDNKKKRNKDFQDTTDG